MAHLVPIRDQLEVTAYGADPTGTRDSTRAINRAFDDARQDLHVVAHLPAGTYVASDGLLWDGPFPRITGVPGETFIQFDAQAYDWLTINGGQATDRPGGYIRDVRLVKAPALPNFPSGLKAGLKLDGARFTTVENVYVNGAPITLDLDNNCFGSEFYTVRSDNCRGGLLLRGAGTQATFGHGNDLPFFNSWIRGRDWAIWKEPTGGHDTIFGGQFGLIGATTFDDLRGNLVMNATIADGLGGIGSGGLTFVGTSFEPTVQGWAFRLYAGGGGLTLISPFCNSANGQASGAEGFIKVGDTTGFALGRNEAITWIDLHMDGVWENATPVQFNTDTTQHPSYTEINSRGFPTINSGQVDLRERGLIGISQHASRAFSVAGRWNILHGTLMRALPGQGKFQISFDWGANWQNVDYTADV